jgi:surfeit locus 1 family protein
VTLERRDWALFGCALAIAIGCVWAGFWQLDRLHQRRARNAAVARARELPPLDLGRRVDLAAARDRRLHACGRYDYAHQLVWHGRSYEEIPGVDLLTPLRLADGGMVLVDRGWVPSPDAYHVNQGAYREADSAEVWGLALIPWARSDADPAKLQAALPYPILPFLLQELPPAEPSQPAGVARVQAPPIPARLRRWPAPALSDGPHLSYAIQWFSFALIIGVGSGALIRQRARGAAGRGGTAGEAEGGRGAARARETHGLGG